MIGNAETNAEAYDATCRIPGCDWFVENVTPTLVAIHVVRHSDAHGPIGAPKFALRIRAGFEGTDPENPHRTSADGWNRDPSPSREQVDEWKARHDALISDTEDQQ